MRLGCSFLVELSLYNTVTLLTLSIPLLSDSLIRNSHAALRLNSHLRPFPRTGRAEQNGSNAFPYTGDCIIRLRAGGHGYQL